MSERKLFPISANESVAWSPVEKTIAFAHYIDARRHVGKVYKFTDLSLIAASGSTRDIHISVPSGIYIEASVLVNTTDAAEVYLYELDSVVGNGTGVTQTYNMNRESRAVSGVSFYHTPDTPSGNVIDRATSLSGTIFNGRWNLRNNKSYMIRIVSRAANNYTAIQMMYTENGSEYDMSSSSSSSSSSASNSSSSSSSSASDSSASSASDSSASSASGSSSSSWSTSSPSSPSSESSSESSSRSSHSSSSSSRSSESSSESSSSLSSSSLSSSLGLSSSSSDSSSSAGV